MKMCICNFDGDKIILIEIRPLKLSHFMQLFTLLGIEVVKSTSPTVCNRSFSDLHTLCGCNVNVYVEC